MILECRVKLTILGAMRQERVIAFSGGAPGLLWTKVVITKQSPEVTAFTLPLSHWFSVADAIFTGLRPAPTTINTLLTKKKHS